MVTIGGRAIRVTGQALLIAIVNVYVIEGIGLQSMFFTIPLNLFLAAFLILRQVDGMLDDRFGYTTTR